MKKNIKILLLSLTIIPKITYTVPYNNSKNNSKKIPKNTSIISKNDSLTMIHKNTCKYFYYSIYCTKFREKKHNLLVGELHSLRNSKSGIRFYYLM